MSSRRAPTLIADTGPRVAMLNAKDWHHEACTLLARFRTGIGSHTDQVDRPACGNHGRYVVLAGGT